MLIADDVVQLTVAECAALCEFTGPGPRGDPRVLIDPQRRRLYAYDGPTAVRARLYDVPGQIGRPCAYLVEGDDLRAAMRRAGTTIVQIRVLDPVVAVVSSTGAGDVVLGSRTVAVRPPLADQWDRLDSVLAGERTTLPPCRRFTLDPVYYLRMCLVQDVTGERFGVDVYPPTDPRDPVLLSAEGGGQIWAAAVMPMWNGD